MTKLCDTFRSRAISTWDLLRRARVNDFQPGEETITELNLLEIRRKHPQEVLLHKFTKRKESLMGADWEWWLTGSSRRWLGLRVQAKIVNLKLGTFPHLHYKGKSGYQTDVLIHRALSDNPPRIPLYCLYSNWDTKLISYSWPCWSFQASVRSYGCSFISALLVRFLRLRCSANNLTDLLPYMLPWQCLVCCYGYRTGDLPNRAYHYWRRAILLREDRALEGLEEDLRNRYRSIEPVANPPSYVQHLLQGGEPERLEDRGLQGVIVIREEVESEGV